MTSITQTPELQLSTVLVIDLSSAVDSQGWMDSHAALRLMLWAEDAVEVNIGSARAGFALELMAEFLQAATEITIKGTDPEGLRIFSKAVVDYRPPVPDPTMGGIYDPPGTNPFLKGA